MHLHHASTGTNGYCSRTVCKGFGLTAYARNVSSIGRVRKYYSNERTGQYKLIRECCSGCLFLNAPLVDFNFPCPVCNAVDGVKPTVCLFCETQAARGRTHCVSHTHNLLKISTPAPCLCLWQLSIPILSRHVQTNLFILLSLPFVSFWQFPIPRLLQLKFPWERAEHQLKAIVPDANRRRFGQKIKAYWRG